MVQYKTTGLSQGCSSTIVENKEEIMIKIHYTYGLMKKQWIDNYEYDKYWIGCEKLIFNI